MLRRTELFIKYAYRNNSITPPPPPGGAYSKLDLQEEGGLIREGALIQKEAFLKGDLFETHIMVQDGLVVPGKYIAKGPKKRLEVLKSELDKRAIKLNYMKLDIGVIMQKIFLRTCNQWVVFFD